MTNARTTIVQNIAKRPGTLEPLAGRKVSIRLNPVSAFIDGGTTEILRTRTVTTDATGLWSAELDVNADIDPAGSYYTVQEFPGVIWTFIVPYSATPVTLRSCLVVDPTNPNPLISGLAGVTATDGSIIVGGTAQLPDLRVNETLFDAAGTAASAVAAEATTRAAADTAAAAAIGNNTTAIGNEATTRAAADTALAAAIAAKTALSQSGVVSSTGLTGAWSLA